MSGSEVQEIGGFLPRVHPDAAQVSRIAFDARFALWLARLSGRTDLSVMRRLPPDDAMLLDIEAGDGNAHVALDAGEWPALQLALAMEDEALSCAVASALLTPWLSMLGQDLGPARVVRRVRLASRSPETCAVIATPQARVSLLRLTPALRQALHARLAAIPPQALQRFGALQLRARLRLLERVLPEPALRALAPGDVVLLAAAAGQAIPLTFIAGKGMTMQAEATYDPNTEQATLTAEPAPAAESAGPDDAGSLDELQLPVAFEIDSARMTLGELAGMRPGYVIELERPITAATVRLVCHGQVIGQGQLVAVGEQMGIRIVRMGLAAAGQPPQGPAA